MNYVFFAMVDLEGVDEGIDGGHWLWMRIAFYII
jgi:hypothetical protein